MSLQCKSSGRHGKTTEAMLLQLEWHGCTTQAALFASAMLRLALLSTATQTRHLGFQSSAGGAILCLRCGDWIVPGGLPLWLGGPTDGVACRWRFCRSFDDTGYSSNTNSLIWRGGGSVAKGETRTTASALIASYQFCYERLCIHVK